MAGNGSAENRHVLKGNVESEIRLQLRDDLTLFCQPFKRFDGVRDLRGQITLKIENWLNKAIFWCAP